MKASAIIVTRGNVDLAPVLESLPWEWEIVVWDNSHGYANRQPPGGRDWNTWTSIGRGPNAPDLSVYGRYAAIKYASHDLIYVQDDDVIVSDPQAIVDKWTKQQSEHNESETDQWRRAVDGGEYDAQESWTDWDGLVANMPQEFRHDGYTDSCLVGFGACFHRDLPGRAFQRWEASKYSSLERRGKVDPSHSTTFNRTCDVVFTALTPRVLVDVPITHREFASDPDRMWKQPGHVGERTRMLELARKVRDA